MLPSWRELFDSWEKAVAPGLEGFTASTEFRDLMAMSAKASAGAINEVERASRRWLHMWNLPAASDMRRLRQQMSSIDKEVASLRRAVEGALDAQTAERLLADLDAVLVDAPNGTSTTAGTKR